MKSSAYRDTLLGEVSQKTKAATKAAFEQEG
jgi:hypothetical protein